MNRANILYALQKYKEQSAEKYGILQLGVFGSAAREQMTENSDIDVIVNLQEQDLFALVGIKQELEDYFHVQVDVISYRPRMDSFLKERIDKEAVYV
jgi:predicted nucleotidyltransferase